MPNTRRPRFGSMQYWPRKRAIKSYPRVHAWAKFNDVKLLGFAGYKVGMTHILATDGYKNSMTKGEEISIPVTVIECPPIRIAFIRFYNKSGNALTQIYSKNIDKTLGRKISLPKKETQKLEEIKTYSDVTAVVYTQPKMIGIGKKKPELFEIRLSGKVEDKLKFLTEHMSKEIPINEVFKEGDLLDLHAVTKGKGIQGPMKRFGIGRKRHKSEKGTRNPGGRSGGWKAQGHMMYRVPTAGQMGFHIRTEYNKLLLKIGAKPEEVNQEGGFMRYGVVKNPFILIKGTVGGPKKRMIRLNFAIRPNNKISERKVTIEKISTTRK